MILQKNNEGISESSSKGKQALCVVDGKITFSGVILNGIKSKGDLYIFDSEEDLLSKVYELGLEEGLEKYNNLKQRPIRKTVEEMRAEAKYNYEKRQQNAG